MLVDERLAAQQMTSGAKTGVAYMSLSQAGIQLTTEPFFKSMLVALYKDRMQNLLSRARILLPPAEARLMIGVMDETGTLQPGQVRIKSNLFRTSQKQNVFVTLKFQIFLIIFRCLCSILLFPATLIAKENSVRLQNISLQDPWW